MHLLKNATWADVQHNGPDNRIFTFFNVLVDEEYCFVLEII